MRAFVDHDRYWRRYLGLSGILIVLIQFAAIHNDHWTKYSTTIDSTT